MFGDNSIMAEISQAIDKVREAMQRTADPVKMAELRKDLEVLKDEYRSEVAFLYGM